MSIISIVLIMSSVFVVNITAEEKFCEKNRTLLLGGVFNYDNIIFGYSWKAINISGEGKSPERQLMLVWSYEVKGNHLVPLGKATAVDELLPGIPLFKAGFGLTLKCEENDSNCQSYRQLVFIFSQSYYKVYRYVNKVFIAETDDSKIPWGLKNKGDAIDWSFGNKEMTSLNAIMFSGGSESQIFAVSGNSLFVSSVSLKTIKGSLNWTKLSQNDELRSILGGFVVGSDMFLNKNTPKSEQTNVLFKYDLSGKLMTTISVWDYFECDKFVVTNEKHPAAGRDVIEQKREVLKEQDDKLAVILLVCIVVAIVFVDIIVGVFWFCVYKRNKNSSKV